MATNTYVALDKKTTTTSVASIEFTSIPQGYTDLVLIVNGSNTTSDQGLVCQVGNGSVDTAANYSTTFILGSGTSATTGRSSGDTYAIVGRMSNDNSTSIINFMNYSNTTTKKSILGRGNNGAMVIQHVAMWQGTSAINTIKVFNLSSVNIAAGATFSLYGIAAEGVSPTPKATGGAIYSDSTYYYHVFGSTGVFTPTQSLSADVLVIAGGGGGGGGNYGGGGGAGGFRVLTSQSMTTTAYTCTVGAGGTAGVIGSRGGTGTNSSVAGSGFSTIASSGGGGGGRDTNTSTGEAIGLPGGSGGGNYTNATSAGGSGNAGSYSPVEGYAGGSGGTGGAGGGGGGGGSAEAGNTDGQSHGGDGTSAYSTWGVATGTGQNVSGTYYYAGGGGGGAGAGYSGGQNIETAGGLGGGGNGGGYNVVGNMTDGQANTGGGGGAFGGTGSVSKAGGSGLVIVRYLKA